MQDGKNVILCIDDDPDVLLALRILLEKSDFAVVTAPSAEDGLKVYKSDSPDAVIVDLMMEEVDAGVQFVKELRLLNNSAPVFMLSSVGDSLNAAADYSDLGLSGVLQKPVNKDELLVLLAAKL